MNYNMCQVEMGLKQFVNQTDESHVDNELFSSWYDYVLDNIEDLLELDDMHELLQRADSYGAKHTIWFQYLMDVIRRIFVDKNEQLRRNTVENRVGEIALTTRNEFQEGITDVIVGDYKICDILLGHGINDVYRVYYYIYSKTSPDENEYDNYIAMRCGGLLRYSDLDMLKRIEGYSEELIFSMQNQFNEMYPNLEQKFVDINEKVLEHVFSGK